MPCGLLSLLRVNVIENGDNEAALAKAAKALQLRPYSPYINVPGSRLANRDIRRPFTDDVRQRAEDFFLSLGKKPYLNSNWMPEEPPILIDNITIDYPRIQSDFEILMEILLEYPLKLYRWLKEIITPYLPLILDHFRPPAKSLKSRLVIKKKSDSTIVDKIHHLSHDIIEYTKSLTNR